MPTRLHAPDAQSVTFVELFFDLVFVFALTQVTALTAENLDASGVARSLVIFWLIWWAWTQFVWTLNPADTRHTVVQALTLGATATAFVMATSIPQAFEDEALWFTIPYVMIRVLGLGLQVRLDREHEADVGISMVWIGISVVGLGVVLLGGVVDESARAWVWLAAIAIDLVAAGLSGRNAVWDLDTAHFSERHGLFVIIALGESLIVTGTSVAADERTADLVLVAGAVLIIACLLWWTYFSWLKEAMEEAFAEVPAERRRTDGPGRLQPRPLPAHLRDHRLRRGRRGDHPPSGRARIGWRDGIARPRTGLVRGRFRVRLLAADRPCPDREAGRDRPEPHRRDPHGRRRAGLAPGRGRRGPPGHRRQRGTHAGARRHRSRAGRGVPRLTTAGRGGMLSR